jgi:hypothetical protein
MPTQREEEQVTGVAGNDHCTLTTSHQWLINNPMKAVKYAAPVAGVVLAGPLVSLLPLGSFTPLISMVVTFLASSTLKQNAVGGALALLQAGGMQKLAAQILAFLSFLGFGKMSGE